MHVKSITAIFKNGIISKNQRWHKTNADFLCWGIHVFKRVELCWIVKSFTTKFE